MTDNVNNHLDRVTDKLATVSQLISCGFLKQKGNKICGNLIVETVYDDEASMIVIEKGMAGQDFPLHVHVNCMQLLICVHGKFSVRIPNENIIRVLRPKSVFTVGENQAHSVHCLEDNSKLIGVVIPAEPAYRTEG